MTPTIAAQIEALAPCPNPWCTSRSAPLPVRSRMASNGWHVACACGVRSWSCPTEAEAIAKWNTRPAIVTALRQAEAAPGVVEALTELRGIAENVLSAMDRYNAENGTHLGGAPFIRLGRAIANADQALARQHGAREGWVMVPREPTEAMSDAGFDVYPVYYDEIYRAMIAAAPATDAS